MKFIVMLVFFAWAALAATSTGKLFVPSQVGKVKTAQTASGGELIVVSNGVASIWKNGVATKFVSESQIGGKKLSDKGTHYSYDSSARKLYFAAAGNRVVSLLNMGNLTLHYVYVSSQTSGIKPLLEPEITKIQTSTGDHTYMNASGISALGDLVFAVVYASPAGAPNALRRLTILYQNGVWKEHGITRSYFGVDINSCISPYGANILIKPSVSSPLAGIYWVQPDDSVRQVVGPADMINVLQCGTEGVSYVFREDGLIKYYALLAGQTQGRELYIGKPVDNIIFSADDKVRFVLKPNGDSTILIAPKAGGLVQVVNGNPTVLLRPSEQPVGSGFAEMLDGRVVYFVSDNLGTYTSYGVYSPVLTSTSFSLDQGAKGKLVGQDLLPTGSDGKPVLPLMTCGNGDTPSVDESLTFTVPARWSGRVGCTLIVGGQGGIPFSFEVNVKTVAVQPAVKLEATPRSVIYVPGSIAPSTSLCWETSAATSVTFAPLVTPVVTPAEVAKGCRTIHPTETTTYVMSASGPGGIVSTSTTVIVEIGKQRPVVSTIYPATGTGNSFAPGELVTIEGTDLTGFVSNNLILPGVIAANRKDITDFGGTRVRVGTTYLPITFANTWDRGASSNPSQVNFQLPYLQPGQHELFVERDDLGGGNRVSSVAFSFKIEQNAPTLFGSWELSLPLLMQDVNNGMRLVDQSNPARAGGIYVVYGTGLGLYDSDVPLGKSAGEVLPPGVFAHTLVPVGAWVKYMTGGQWQLRPVIVLYAVASPQFVGVTQLAFQIPADIKPESETAYLILKQGEAYSEDYAFSISK